MADIVSQEVRSRMMSGIRGKNTNPEMIIRRGLHARGFRYRLHEKRLPGKPDLVFPKYRAIVFVHGCFWHGHGCHLFRWPKTRPDFWRNKIQRNIALDRQALLDLKRRDWRIAIIWECAIKGRTRLSEDSVFRTISRWIPSNSQVKQITGKHLNDSQRTFV